MCWAIRMAETLVLEAAIVPGSGTWDWVVCNQAFALQTASGAEAVLSSVRS